MTAARKTALIAVEQVARKPESRRAIRGMSEHSGRPEIVNKPACRAKPDGGRLWILTGFIDTGITNARTEAG
jgi:hypothetical protein